MIGFRMKRISSMRESRVQANAEEKSAFSTGLNLILIDP